MLDGGTLEICVLLFIYTCWACASWAVKNVIEAEKMLVLAGEIDVCAFTRADAIALGDANAA
jgi:hypothetical protein